jgi:hypothetical protein
VEEAREADGIINQMCFGPMLQALNEECAYFASRRLPTLHRHERNPDLPEAETLRKRIGKRLGDIGKVFKTYNSG